MGADIDARAYVQQLQADGPQTLVTNVTSDMLLIEHAGFALPTTVNHGDLGASYVVAPHSAYVLYAREELGLVDLGWLKRPAQVIIALADRLFKALRINTVVLIDNWLLSTNLHGAWHGEGLADIRARLIADYPDHFLGVRSVDRWTDPRLPTALAADGWIMLPSRIIWVTDDLKRDWAARNNVKNDRRKLRQSGLTVEDLTQPSDAEAERIVALYKMLYVEKYSALNPQYSAAWLKLAMACGLLKMRVARDADGQIMAAAGFVVRGDVATNPLLGYDTAQPQAAGLYRIACYMFGDYACAHGLRVNGSAGAGDFKRQRGARSEIEYTAFYARHLPRWRRWPLHLIATLLTVLVMPVMARRML